MFAYCNNNPVNMEDYGGNIPGRSNMVFVEDGARGYGSILTSMSGGAAAVGAAVVVKKVVEKVVEVGTTVGTDITTIFSEPTINEMSKEEEQVDAVLITQEPDNPVIFPVNPNDFNPVCLIQVPRSGTKNGAFISWMDPVTNTEVFRWDENPNYPNGPHYHIYGTGHYYPGDIVPEPYATIYFPFR